MILTVENMKRINICNSGINFARVHGLLNIPAEWLLYNSEGAHSFKSKLEQKLPVRSLSNMDGHMVWFENILGQTIKQRFDNKGRMIYYIRSDGYSQKRTYNSNDDIVEIKYSNGMDVRRTFNSDGDVTKAIMSDGRKERFFYRNGKLIQITNKIGVVNFNYKYYKSGQLKEITANNSCIMSIPEYKGVLSNLEGYNESAV